MKLCTKYSRVHISSDSLFSKILKKPFMVHKKWYLIWMLFFIRWSKKSFIFSENLFCIISKKTSSLFIWGVIFLCTMNGFFRILEKRLSELICTWLEVWNPQNIVSLYVRHYNPLFVNFLPTWSPKTFFQGFFS